MIAPERYAQFLDGLSDGLRNQVMVETSRKFIAKCWLLGAFHEVSIMLLLLYFFSSVVS